MKLFTRNGWAVAASLLAAVAVGLGGCAASWTALPAGYRDYSETIDVPGLSKTDVFIKTYLWIQELAEQKSLNVVGYGSAIEREELVVEGSLYVPHKEYTRNPNCKVTLGFKDGTCELSFRYLSSEYRVKYPEILELTRASWNNINKSLKTYLSAAPVSEDEVARLVIAGDEAFDRGDFSGAMRYYRQILKNDPSDIVAFVLYAHCVEELTVGNADRFKPNPGEKEYDYDYVGSTFLYKGGWLGRLRAALEEDIKYSDEVMKLYNLALSLDPDNEDILLYLDINKTKKESKVRLLSEVKEREAYWFQVGISEREQRIADQWVTMAASLNSLAVSVSRLQQQRSGGGSGQSMYGVGDDAGSGQSMYGVGDAAGSGGANCDSYAQRIRTYESRIEKESDANDKRKDRAAGKNAAHSLNPEKFDAATAGDYRVINSSNQSIRGYERQIKFLTRQARQAGCPGF